MKPPFEVRVRPGGGTWTVFASAPTPKDAERALAHARVIYPKREAIVFYKGKRAWSNKGR